MGNIVFWILSQPTNEYLPISTSVGVNLIYFFIFSAADKRAGIDIFLMVSVHPLSVLLRRNKHHLCECQVISTAVSLFSRITGLSSFPIQILEHYHNNQEVGGEGTISPVPLQAIWPLMPANCNLLNVVNIQSQQYHTLLLVCHIIKYQSSVPA